MKHYRIVNKYRFTAFVLVVLLLLCFAVSSVFNHVNAKSGVRYVSVNITEGDTLWTIAKEYGSDHKDIRRVIYDICKANDITADSLRPGQTILVPEE